MKKIFMTLAAVSIAATVNAQVFVGGGIGFQTTSHDDNSDTYIKLMPEIGFNLNDNWALGVAFGYSENKVTNTVAGADITTKTKLFQISPYARYTFLHFDRVNLFVDGGLDYSHSDAEGNKINAFAVGLKPGVAVNLNDKLSFVAHVGYLGWRTSKADQEGAKAFNTFNFAFDGSDLSFGLYYNF